MVTVRLFGIFRVESGVKSLTAEVSSVRELFPLIIAEAKRIDPDTGLTARDLRGCIVSVNGRQASLSAKLAPGDEVMLVPAVAGG